MCIKTSETANFKYQTKSIHPMHVLIHIYENLNSEIEVKEIIEMANVIKTVINTHWNANRKMHISCE